VWIAIAAAAIPRLLWFPGSALAPTRIALIITILHTIIFRTAICRTTIRMPSIRMTTIRMPIISTSSRFRR
jgi:hypothetical protein